MIKTESAYKTAVERLNQDQSHLKSKRAALILEGLTEAMVDRALEPEMTFHAQLQEEVAWYRSARRGDVQTIRTLTEIGRVLIALRIAAGLSQRDLANRLGVDESLVSRNEKNEYEGIGVDGAQAVIDACEASLELSAHPPEQELVTA